MSLTSQGHENECAQLDLRHHSGCLQLPPAFHGDRRRPCPGMAPHGRDLPALVRRHPGRHQGTGGVERRRDGMAGAGSDLLAVVFGCKGRSVLPDRS